MINHKDSADTQRMSGRRNSNAGSSSAPYKAPNEAFYKTYPAFHPVTGYLRRLPESYQHVQQYYAALADKRKKKPFSLHDYTAEGDYNADKVLPPRCCRHAAAAATTSAADAGAPICCAPAPCTSVLLCSLLEPERPPLRAPLETGCCKERKYRPFNRARPSKERRKNPGI